ncbi:unnamed protein product [Prunus armeniaca]|uniref:Uncharacterized protein n=1 Tax=Prunus armeniaca TaxID=36596 RepID=A0A6J5WDZ6_PRUAR|nr:unnamed protein product [Prunus armeniaca]
MDFPPQKPRLVAENGLSFRITDVQSINWASDEDEEAAEEGGGHHLLLLHLLHRLLQHETLVVLRRAV